MRLHWIGIKIESSLCIKVILALDKLDFDLHSSQIGRRVSCKRKRNFHHKWYITVIHSPYFNATWDHSLQELSSPEEYIQAKRMQGYAQQQERGNEVIEGKTALIQKPLPLLRAMAVKL